MNGLKQDPDVKMDHDAITPSGSGYMDDDFYEDTGELSLPKKGVEKDVWVTRIPKWLYEAVSKYEDVADGRDDDQIVIGEVLAMRDPSRPGQLSKTDPMRLFLNNRSVAEKKLPQAFELKMTPASQEVLGNTYVFTEKDLPGFKPTGFGPGRGPGGSFGYGIQDPKAKVQKRSKYRKAIPKQTSLIGSTTREYNATPLPTKEFVAFNKARIREAIQGKESRVNIRDDNLNDHILDMNVQKMFKSFIRPATATRTQTNKAARIPKNELIDALHACFDEYSYWSMKALKGRTRQPEAYLKEVLQEIAVLVKAGPFASTWKRMSMYEKNVEGQKEEAAPEQVGGDDDDDDEEMENVI